MLPKSSMLHANPLGMLTSFQTPTHHIYQVHLRLICRLLGGKWEVRIIILHVIEKVRWRKECDRLVLEVGYL